MQDGMLLRLLDPQSSAERKICHIDYAAERTQTDDSSSTSFQITCFLFAMHIRARWSNFNTQCKDDVSITSQMSDALMYLPNICSDRYSPCWLTVSEKDQFVRYSSDICGCDLLGESRTMSFADRDHRVKTQFALMESDPAFCITTSLDPICLTTRTSGTWSLTDG